MDCAEFVPVVVGLDPLVELAELGVGVGALVDDVLANLEATSRGCCWVVLVVLESATALQ